MLNVLFKIMFDQTSQVNKNFAQLSSDITQMNGKLKAAHAQLEGKDWVGVGAEQFNRDMNDTLMPALDRLAKAMQAGADHIGKAEKIMHKADDDQKSIWQKLPDFFLFKFGG